MHGCDGRERLRLGPCSTLGRRELQLSCPRLQATGRRDRASRRAGLGEGERSRERERENFVQHMELVVLGILPTEDK